MSITGHSVSNKFFVVGVVIAVIVSATMSSTITWLVMTLGQLERKETDNGSQVMAQPTPVDRSMPVSNNGENVVARRHSGPLGSEGDSARVISSAQRNGDPKHADDMIKREIDLLCKSLTEEAASQKISLSVNDAIAGIVRNVPGPMFLLKNREYPDRKQYEIIIESIQSSNYPGATREAMVGLIGDAVVPETGGKDGKLLLECKIGLRFFWYPDRGEWEGKDLLATYEMHTSSVRPGVGSRIERKRVTYVGTALRELIASTLSKSDSIIRFDSK